MEGGRGGSMIAPMSDLAINIGLGVMLVGLIALTVVAIRLLRSTGPDKSLSKSAHPGEKRDVNGPIIPGGWPF